MTDYDIVCNLRRILKQLEIEGVAQTDEKLDQVYDLLDATGVSK